MYLLVIWMKTGVSTKKIITKNKLKYNINGMRYHIEKV